MSALPRRELEMLVERQLGRRTAIPYEAAVYCEFGWPAVISCAPYAAPGKPNPNIYYLTCPFLRREVASLEDHGWITRFNRLAAAEPAFGAAAKAAHKQHATLWQSLAGGPWPGPEREAPRIAAAASDDVFKCLHAHVAWHLVVGGYPPGELIIRHIGSTWCRDNRCASFLVDDASQATGSHGGGG